MASSPPCFHEADANIALVRRAAAEGLGTMLLVFAASAGGIAAARLFPGEPGMVVWLIAMTVAGTLVSLIVAIGKISGGHYNPLITLAQLLSRERSLKCASAYFALQLAGGLAGGSMAAALWQVPRSVASHAGVNGFASEFLASAGLMLIVLGASRSAHPETGPFAVGAWLSAAVIATPTHSYANPAVAIGAMVSAGPIAVGSSTAALYVAAQVAGTVLALAIITFLLPSARRPA